MQIIQHIFYKSYIWGNVSDGELVSTGYRVVREAYDLILIVVMMADNVGYRREAWL